MNNPFPMMTLKMEVRTNSKYNFIIDYLMSNADFKKLKYVEFISTSKRI